MTRCHPSQLYRRLRTALMTLNLDYRRTEKLIRKAEQSLLLSSPASECIPSLRTWDLKRMCVLQLQSLKMRSSKHFLYQILRLAINRNRLRRKRLWPRRRTAENIIFPTYWMISWFTEPSRIKMYRKSTRKKRKCQKEEQRVKVNMNCCHLSISLQVSNT